MKRLTLLLAFFLLGSTFTDGKDYRHWKRLQIKSVIPDDQNEKLYIYGLNLGDPPVAWLNDDPLDIQVANDNFIEAVLPILDPGTYRLLVARRASQYPHPRKMDMMDVTLGAEGPKGDKPAHEWDSTQLRFENPDSSWGDYVDLKGAAGPEGPQGIQGPRGFKGDKGDKGDQGDPGSPGPASASGWSAYRSAANNALVFAAGEHADWQTIPGLTITLDLSDSALVQMTVTGMQHTWGSGYSHAGYRFVIDGLGRGDGTWGQRIQTSTPESWLTTWAMSDSVSFPSGTHTIQVQAVSRGASAGTAICGLSNRSTYGYTGCNLNVIAFHQ